MLSTTSRGTPRTDDGPPARWTMGWGGRGRRVSAARRRPARRRRALISQRAIRQRMGQGNGTGATAAAVAVRRGWVMDIWIDRAECGMRHERALAKAQRRRFQSASSRSASSTARSSATASPAAALEDQQTSSCARCTASALHCWTVRRPPASSSPRRILSQSKSWSARSSARFPSPLCGAHPETFHRNCTDGMGRRAFRAEETCH